MLFESAPATSGRTALSRRQRGESWLGSYGRNCGHLRLSGIAGSNAASCHSFRPSSRPREFTLSRIRLHRSGTERYSLIVGSTITRFSD